jgi:Xaa-Pro aminopeptidase
MGAAKTGCHWTHSNLPSSMMSSFRQMPSGIRVIAGVLSVGAAASLSAQTPTVNPDPFQLPPLAEPRPIGQAEYAQRRAYVAEEMGDGVLVVFGAGDPELEFLPFGQNSSFRYLTGILEPEAALILVRTGSRLEPILFVQARDPASEIWEGSRLGVEGARSLTGLRTETNDRLSATLDSLLNTRATLHTLASLPTGRAAAGAVLTREQQFLRRLVDRNPSLRLVSLEEALDVIRSRKSPAELDLIRRAVHVSTLAHREAIRSVEPGMNEFEIEAVVEFLFRRNGAERPAYSSIVGSGPNSTTLHYRDADRVMQDGELLLMDVGASYQGYAADVTRTVPINGRFTADQRAIYNIVLNAMKMAEEEISAGARWADLDNAANRVITQGLDRLGLIDSPDATYDCQTPQGPGKCPQFRLYYMHSLGHGVGLDVHDPDASYFGSFQPGSAFTVEPGIYVRGDVLDYLMDTAENRAMRERLRSSVARYAGTGVRIEDVYVVTEAGVERVSSGVPREINEVEALMTETGLGQFGRRGGIVDWHPATSGN